MSTGRRLAVKVFFGFLAVMAVCTVLSRAAASVLVAQVEVKKTGRGKLSYTCGGTGNIVPKKEQKIFLWEGQQVEWTAPQGSTVKKGKCLVKFRKKYLKQEIEKKEAELEQLNLQAKEQQISARKPARVPAAKSAYQALTEAEKKLKKAEDKEKKAKALWEAYREQESYKSQEAYNNQEAYKNQESYKNQETSEDGGGSLKKQELKESYQAAKAETEAARQERSQARAAYELAKAEDAAQDKNSANTQEAARTSAQAAAAQAETAGKELKLLKQYEKAGGKILAKKDCTVLENHVQTGVIAAGTEYIVLGNGGWKLRGEVAQADKDRIAPGIQATAEFSSGGKTEAEVETVEASSGSEEEGKEKESSYIWYASLPQETEVEGTETFTWKAEAESEKEYEQIIPISALREDMEGAYCLIISEKEQMLGTLMVAKRVPVTVLEKDGKSAAITSELKREDQIIISSEKFVSGGDRVRIKE